MENAQVTRKNAPRTSPTGAWQQTMVSVGILSSAAMGGQTGEVHVRQDQVHENVRLSPYD